MAPKNSSSTAATSEPDLLGEIEAEQTAAPQQDVLDLLGGMSEATGTNWRPKDNPEHPKGIQGTVTGRDVFTDPRYGDSPLVSLRTTGGEEWKVFGFGTVLKGEINKLDPQPGDLLAVKYLGLVEGRNGAYPSYKLAIRKAEGAQAAPATSKSPY